MNYVLGEEVVSLFWKATIGTLGLSCCARHGILWSEHEPCLCTETARMPLLTQSRRPHPTMLMSAVISVSSEKYLQGSMLAGDVTLTTV